MIVVLGRPRIDERGGLSGSAGRIAAAAVANGAGVELVGSVTDDADGDAAITELGRTGIGHAALLRMPTTAEPRLDAADIELGLRYVSECRVLVLADALDREALAAAVEGARYHGAHLVSAAALPPGGGGGRSATTQLPDDATVLAPPAGDEAAFSDLVGRYAAQLDAGRGAADAWRDALSATGWEQAAEDDRTDDSGPPGE